MKDLVLLGATGSIGTQTLDVIDYLNNDWNIKALSAHTSIDMLERQIRKYKPEFAVVTDDKSATKLKKRLNNINTEVLKGIDGMKYAASLTDIDLVINAVVGAAGLEPSLAALKAGNKLGLANKESLVIGGHLIEKELQRQDAEILPIDSEHNAVFQLITDHNNDDVENILLTASGGPFYDLSREKLSQVTREDALDHPNWDMGNKITIDSATMMNKGLEVIEAHWLFGTSYDNIKVVVHPESIIHSMVELKDKTIMAEMGTADMRTPILNVLSYPERIKGPAENLDLFAVSQLNFLPPDFDKFPALKLAYEAGREGGSMPVVLNAANEIVVRQFLLEKISFNRIPIIIEKVMNKHELIKEPSLDEVLKVDQWARREAKEAVYNDYDNS